MSGDERREYRPAGHQGMTVYLAVSKVREAIDFYVAAFDARELFIVEPDGGTTFHAEISIAGTVIALHGDLPGTVRGRPPHALGGTTATFTLWVPDVDAAFERAVGVGARVDSPPRTMYWGDRTARITDPAGHGWSLATHVEDVDPEEQHRRARTYRGRQDGVIDFSGAARIPSDTGRTLAIAPRAGRFINALAGLIVLTFRQTCSEPVSCRRASPLPAAPAAPGVDLSLDHR